jgi:hypothetical protein
MRSMSDADAERFAALALEDRYGVWALNLTDAGRNVRVWKAIEPGDIAAFYAHKRFEYFAPILFTWKSDSLEEIAGWKPPKSGRYSLALAVGKLEPCDLGNLEYRALVKYERVPVHSDFHDADTSRELLAALKGELPKDGDLHDLDPEGAIRYRIQQFRERSDGNRLHVFELRGHTCEVCGYDFARQFGDGFTKSAVVHHKNPLALGARKAVSVDEFAVLCAPCHTAVHMGVGRKLNPWTVKELRAIIRKRWDN